MDGRLRDESKATFRRGQVKIRYLLTVFGCLVKVGVGGLAWWDGGGIGASDFCWKVYIVVEPRSTRDIEIMLIFVVVLSILVC